MLKLPHIIAICGYPKTGKSKVQEILAEVGVQIVDDGGPLRDFAQRHLGLSWRDVHTQEGKADTNMIAGQWWENRKILGDLGKKLEELFGPNIMPFMATRKLCDVASYSFGSVRRKQGKFYQSLGGVVLGVNRAGVGPSGNDFDEFDHSIVDYWIDNDGSLDDLRFKIEVFLQLMQFTSVVKMVA